MTFEEKVIKEFDELWVGGEKPPVWEKFKSFLKESLEAQKSQIISLGEEVKEKHKKESGADDINCCYKEAIEDYKAKVKEL